MGNSNRRASPRPSQTGAVWDEANVLRLISEHKLAPKYGDSTSGARNLECPICFLDFGILNTVNCCKQHICTDCLVQVKGTTGKGACPFCGNAELNAALVPLEKNKPPSTPGNKASALNPAKDTDDRRSSITSETDRSSGGSTKALSYTTPEQEKKLRSYSLDDTTPSNGQGTSGSNSHTASKNDREALERQIREQRLQFDERDLAEATARSARSSNRTSSQSSAMYFRQAVRSRYGTASNTAGSPFGAYLSSRAADMERTTGSDTATSNSPGNPDRTVHSANRNNGNIQFVSSLEGLLQTHGSTRITSIEQLEDIMLMEAIRLSMQESTSSTADSTNNINTNTTSNSTTSTNNQATLPTAHTPTNPSPFAPLSPARSGSLRSTPVGRTTTSASSPFRTFATSMGMPGRQESGESGENGDDEVRSSEDSGSEEESHSGEEGEGVEFRYNQTGAYGRYRESLSEEEEADEEELDEEEEQIRLAMELSLADMRAAPNTSNDSSDVNITSSTTNSAGVNTADTYTVSMNTASNIDTAYMDPFDPIPHTNITSSYDQNNCKLPANEKLPVEELVLKPHAEDTLPTAGSSDTVSTEPDTTKTNTTTNNDNNDNNNNKVANADTNTHEEEAAVSPQAVFAEVRL